MDALKRLRQRIWISILILLAAVYITGAATTFDLNPTHWLIFDIQFLRLIITLFLMFTFGIFLRTEQKRRIFKRLKKATKKARRLSYLFKIRYAVFEIKGKYYVVPESSIQEFLDMGLKPLYKTS